MQYYLLARALSLARVTIVYLVYKTSLCALRGVGGGGGGGGADFFVVVKLDNFETPARVPAGQPRPYL